MNGIQKYLKNRVGVIVHLLEQPGRSYTTETFHQLRVEIKKLNALFKLLQYSSAKFDYKKQFKPFKLIFRQAGKVRELQVEESLLKKYIKNSLIGEYRNNLKKQVSNEQRAYFSLINTKFSARLKKTIPKVLPFLKQLNKKKADQYMEKNNQLIAKFLKKNIYKKKEIHELRTRLKHLNYNRKIKDIWKQNKQAKKRTILPELLGKWHDFEITSSHLKKAINNGKINKTEIKQLKKIKTEIIAENALLFHKIISHIRSRANEH